MAPSRASVSPATATAVVPFAGGSSGRKPSRTTGSVPPRTTDTFPRSRFARARSLLEPSLTVGPTKQRGRISVERLVALRDYTKRTSTRRAMLVCILTPVPALALALAIESIPLASPSLNWRHQGLFWLRLVLTGTAMVMFSGLGFQQVVGRALVISLRQMTAIAVLAAALYTVFFVGVAALWTFPIPFLFVIGGVPFMMAEVGAAFAVVDMRKIVGQVEGIKKRTEGLSSVSASVSILYWIYPLYSVAFRFAGPKYQIALLFVLPFFKAQWKKHMCAKLDEVEDLVPMIMMFTIELFNSLYLATCMQSSGSPLTTASIILLDTVLGFTRMHRLHKNMAGLIEKVKALKSESRESDLLAWFIERLHDPATRLDQGELASARVRGNGLQHDLCEASAAIIQSAERKRNNPNKAPNSTTTVLSNDDILLNQTLRLLFECEFMVLAEYIECEIPLLYAIYLPVLRGLPNGVYFGHASALSEGELQSAVLNIVVYWGLESVSLVVMMQWLRHHFGVSVFQLLAFVLDEHTLYVQSNVLIQILFALQFTIAHLGADFSFKFAWIQDPTVKWWLLKT